MKAAATIAAASIKAAIISFGIPASLLSAAIGLACVMAKPRTKSVNVSFEYTPCFPIVDARSHRLLILDLKSSMRRHGVAFWSDRGETEKMPLFCFRQDAVAAMESQTKSTMNKEMFFRSSPCMSSLYKTTQSLFSGPRAYGRLWL